MKPLFFPVSVRKLIIMSVMTLGLYEIYWLFKNWQLIRDRENSNIMPAMRALFGIVFCYGLFRRVKEAGLAYLPSHAPLNAGWLAAGWITIGILANFPFPMDMIGFLSVLFLIPVQKVINRVNLVAMPDMDQNDALTLENVLWMILGIGLFIAYTFYFPN